NRNSGWQAVFKGFAHSISIIPAFGSADDTLSMKLRKYTLALLWLLPMAAWAQEKTALNTAKLDSLLTVLETKNKIMGSVAVFQGDNLAYSRAIGAASIKDGQQTKANTGTRYRVGSITKTF